MNIIDVKETILKWVLSCDKPEQVDLLADVVAEFVVNRFEKTESPLVIEIIRDILISAMADQKLIIRNNKAGD